MLHSNIKRQLYDLIDRENKPMSNRTIIEINHDFAHEIEGDRVGFMLMIEDVIRSGYNANPQSDRAMHLQQQARRFGVRLQPTCHHSHDRVKEFDQ